VRGLFVTATDTGVGKSVLSAAILAAMRAAGVAAVAYKPVLTGLDEPPSAGAWPADDELLGLLAAMDPASVAPLRFGPAVSPHLAAELAGTPIDPRALLDGARRLVPGGETIVVEGVGGLLVPLAEGYSVRDLALALGLGVVIAARPGLGSINHTLLTLESARAAGLDPAAVVLTPWPPEPGAIERSNRETIERLGAIEVHTLATLAGPDPQALAAAGETLPWRHWLERGARN
jgi:dethiobiotin synthetase